MIYTMQTKKAMRIAFQAHKDQVDKSGMPYIFHPYHLAEQMTDEITTCVALLHDVAEDTDITFDELLELGISETVINSLRILTHIKDVPYPQYIRSIKDSGDEAAIVVKLADLKHNSDLSRFELIDDKAIASSGRYIDAINQLKGSG